MQSDSLFFIGKMVKAKEDINTEESSKCLKLNEKDKVSGSQWYAMSATFGRSMKAKEYLDNNGITCFVPMKYVLVPDKKRRKVRKLVPAINNLIFVYTTREVIQEQKTRLGYLHYLTTPINGRNVPILVPESQMRQFMAVCDTLHETLVYLSPDEVHLEKGTPVKIVGGEFDGVEGTFVKVSGKRKKQVVVCVQGIAAVRIVEFADAYLQVIDK